MGTQDQVPWFADPGMNKKMKLIQNVHVVYLSGEVPNALPPEQNIYPLCLNAIGLPMTVTPQWLGRLEGSV